MDTPYSSQTSLLLVEQIKSYWLYILAILLLVSYFCYSNTKKYVKKIMKGGWGPPLTTTNKNNDNKQNSSI